MGCGCNGDNQDKNKKDINKAKKQNYSKNKAQDNFKKSTINKLNDSSSCAEDPYVGYSTIDRITWAENGQSSKVKPPSNLRVVSSSNVAASINWDVPSDYLEAPENYLGFLVVRTIGTQAALSYNTVTYPTMQIVYIGRDNRVGDPDNLTLTSELLYSDAGLGLDNTYSYSVFSISNNFEYSMAQSDTQATITITASSTRVWAETFTGATVNAGNNTITTATNTWTITPNVGSASDVTVGVSHDPLYSSGEKLNFIQLGAVHWVTDGNDKSVVITSPSIPLLQQGETSLQPNTLYNVLFNIRSSYNDSLFPNGVSDDGANAYSGVVTVKAVGCIINQTCSLLQDEDIYDPNNPDTIVPCTPSDCNKRNPVYFGDGGQEISWNYLGSATNGVWTTHGISFITGDSTNSTPNSLYNSTQTTLGTPTQIAAAYSPNPSITITFTNGTISPTDTNVPPAAFNSIAQDLGSVYVRKGAANSKNLLTQATLSPSRNLVLNPTMSFDPTIAANSDGSIAGLAPGTVTVIPASQNWTVGLGYFGYESPYPVTLTAPADTSKFFAVNTLGAGSDFTLQEDIHYMSLIPNQVYQLSFDLKVTGTLVADSKIDVAINNVFKVSAGYFQTTPTDGIDCSNQPAVVPDPAQVTLQLQDYTTTTLYFRVCQPTSPTIYFLFYRDYNTTAQVYFKNISLTTYTPSDSLGTNGYQTPFPMPTVPSMISKGNSPSNFIKTWDFSTPGTSNQSILDWLSKLGSAVQDEITGRWIGGLFCLDQKDSNYTNLSIATDPTISKQVLQITTKANNIIGPANNSPEAAVLMSSEYFCDGVYDINVRLVSVEKDGVPVTPAAGNAVADPVNCSFASWVFHYIDYYGTYAPQELFDVSTIRNAEIDIELGGNCPKNDIYTVDGVQPYRFDVGRLNGWGGNQPGAGGQFEMHTLMPNSTAPNPKQVTLLDGNYHKLTIVLNSGYDLPNVSNTERNNTRLCGYIKWYVDDIPWGCGWVGANYGFDNIPNSAMRFVVGPWFPTKWAGCMCPQQFPCVSPDDPSYNPDNNCKDCAFVLCDNDFIWDEAVFYYTYMSYKPLYENTTALDQTNYLVPPFTTPHGFQPAEIKYPPNRAKWLPESQPNKYFDPQCTADDVPKFPS